MSVQQRNGMNHQVIDVGMDSSSGNPLVLHGDGQESSQASGAIAHRIKEHNIAESTPSLHMDAIDEDEVFSFRKTKSSIRPRNFMRSTEIYPSNLSPFTSPTRIIPGSQTLTHTLPDVPQDAATATVQPEDVRALQDEHVSETGIEIRDDTAQWDAVWKGSWIVPTLEPTSSSGSAVRSSSSSSLRKIPASLKGSLDNRSTVFEGRDGVKVQPRVTELSGIVFALPRFRASSVLTTALQETGAMEKRPLRNDNTEMHLIAKIQLGTFPVFLLAPGCIQPYHVFVSPEFESSTLFLRELFSKEESSKLEERARLSNDQEVGQVGLLLRVTQKPGSAVKRKGVMSSLPKEDDNPFLRPSSASRSTAQTMEETEMCDDPQHRLFHETSMFLVYGALSNNSGSEVQHDTNFSQADNRDPTVSFFAYPLVDQAKFLEQTLLNSRTLNQLRQDAEENDAADLALSEDTGEFVQFDDPAIDSIMNGGDDGSESGYGSGWALHTDIDIDKDESLQEEIELLKALERTKTWSPYTVLAPPDTQTSNLASINSSSSSRDGAKDRLLSRAQTLDRMAFANKSSSSRAANSWSRHKSMDGHSGQLQQELDSAITGSRAARKGISRLKSPTRAPQQPLDVATESLRRKLLGPGSVRKPAGPKSLGSSSYTTMHVGSKSPLRRKSGGGMSSYHLGQGDIPDLTTMLKMKKKQNYGQLVTVLDDLPLSATQGTLSGRRSITQPNPFLDTSRSVQGEQDSQIQMGHKQNQHSTPFTSSSQSKSRPATLPAELATIKGASSSSSSNSVEARNKATVKSLTKSTLAKINIRSDHEDFAECAAVLYRGVKFAMRKDIATKVYHLEELERLMDRHAALM
ncbi:hypothetical protein BGZ51_003503 [Haplosporangium sp. Z 767]|nr:hypothetical protein BGZ51_003503 [Haplosporangium sp. Z 767]KAF9184908.1 hypothetical protein BGZ50_003404 [Haplosporangium sp. Z 11]